MLITIDQLTERLQSSRRTIERHVRSGRLRAIDLGTGKHRDLRFEEEDVEAFLKGQRVSVVKYAPKNAKQVKPKVDYLS
jgi:excisionase family DNA binding protein